MPARFGSNVPAAIAYVTATALPTDRMSQFGGTALIRVRDKIVANIVVALIPRFAAKLQTDEYA